MTSIRTNRELDKNLQGFIKQHPKMSSGTSQNKPGTTQNLQTIKQCPKNVLGDIPRTNHELHNISRRQHPKNVLGDIPRTNQELHKTSRRPGHNVRWPFPSGHLTCRMEMLFVCYLFYSDLFLALHLTKACAFDQAWLQGYSWHQINSIAGNLWSRCKLTIRDSLSSI